jgi:hypothetical protein
VGMTFVPVHETRLHVFDRRQMTSSATSARIPGFARHGSAGPPTPATTFRDGRVFSTARQPSGVEARAQPSS